MYNLGCGKQGMHKEFWQGNFMESCGLEDPGEERLKPKWI
jgi:hypothetical protein